MVFNVEIHNVIVYRIVVDGYVFKLYIVRVFSC